MSKISNLENHLLDFADYIYAHTALKPMSKSLFFVSRLLLVMKHSGKLNKIIDAGQSPTIEDLMSEYNQVREKFSLNADDYDLAQVLNDIEPQLETVLSFLVKIHNLSADFDVLGLAFNSLLRGKFEAGEGLGTHLTPEEVVVPTIEMAMSALNPKVLNALLSEKSDVVAGDITGGTGRFMFHLVKSLEKKKNASQSISKKVYLFDQSKIHTEFCEINFLLESDFKPKCFCVPDSLTSATLEKMKGRFALLLTNPPFGVNKYSYSENVREHFSPEILKFFNFTNRSATIDPAWLFIVKNLDLLIDGGVLGIVLPNGIAHSEEFVRLLETYERLYKTQLSVCGVFSLPTVTFALGGTVAKTTVVLVGKNTDLKKLATSTIEHIGFDKSGNKRIESIHGNELIQVAESFASREDSELLTWSESWRDFARLSPDLIQFKSRKNKNSSVEVESLENLITHRRDFGKIQKNTDSRHLHISILDIDETGLIDVRSCLAQAPVTQPLICEAGDILVSCLNPNIWRATFIPDLPNTTWTCSPEFAVLKPKQKGQMYSAKLFLFIQQQAVRSQVVSLGRGTSSSRQRVKKADLNQVDVPILALSDATIEGFLKSRMNFYKNRMTELEFMRELSLGSVVELSLS